MKTPPADAGGWQTLARDLAREVDGEVRFDRGTRALYNCDASNYRHIPIGVVIPRSKDAVEAAVAVCRRHGAPLVSRGAGTGLAGQTSNHAVVLDFSKYLHRIVAVDADNQTATVEPGVICDQLRARARAFDLTWGPDPATHTHNTFGGMIGNNSCGIHSVMAGRTADNIIALEILTYDGQRMRVGATGDDELARIIAAGGRRGSIYREMKTLRDGYADRIRARYPDIPRRVSGYNLDDLLPEKGFHVARALVGSEGTLVVVLEATVRLVYGWPGRTLVVLGYPDVYQAADHIPEIMAHEPVGCEGIDDKLIRFMKTKHLHLRDLPLLPEGGGWLLVETGGHDKAESEEKGRRLMEALKKERRPPHMKLFTDPEEEAMVWEIRESGLGATANIPGQPLAWPGWEDAAVPPDKIGPYLRDFRQLMDKYEYDAALYGHFGQGCVHCRITFDLFTRHGVEKYRAFVAEAADLVAGYGGSFTAEHGDGQAKSVFLPKLYGEDLVGAFREFKSIWDPQWKMNPGRVVDPLPPEENLRLGPDYAPFQPARTHFQFPADKGSFPRATLRCVGVGKCRRPEKAFMCPSFLATREEKHTTRGRAHLLFEMFRGDFIRDGWRSKEVMESLDLCLSCKGCLSECPVDVDISAYKMEFMSHHYRGRFHPREHYVLGFIGYTALLGKRLPKAANFFTQTPVLSGMLKAALGLARERPLPKFARQPFTGWFEAHPKGGRDGDPVVVYPDVFNDAFDPDVLIALTRVLRRWGYRVILPGSLPPAPLPLMHFGFLATAKRHLRRTIDLLAPFGRREIPIVFAEPSTAAMFRDDLLKLWPNDRDAQRIAKQCCLLSEFAVERDLALPHLEAKAVVHLHCNQKAVLQPKAARTMLTRMGVGFEEPQEGCCGMAGSFGYVDRHLAISRTIAEQDLLPAVRAAAPGTFIVAEGFSCRSQIKDGSGRDAWHPAQLVDYAFERRARDPGQPAGAVPSHAGQGQ